MHPDQFDDRFEHGPLLGEIVSLLASAILIALPIGVAIVLFLQLFVGFSWNESALLGGIVTAIIGATVFLVEVYDLLFG